MVIENIAVVRFYIARANNIVKDLQQRIVSIQYWTRLPPNGVRYWRWGGRGQCVGAEKT